MKYLHVLVASQPQLMFQIIPFIDINKQTYIQDLNSGIVTLQLLDK